jgi:hypothetical protein
MATPAAGGVALLIRQYFSSTFWKSVCDPLYAYCKTFIPSGVLLKAILIHSGSAMTLYNGGGQKDIKLGNPPDFMQGYGRVTLSNVLPLKGVYETQDLFVDDLRNLVEGSSIDYTVYIPSNSAPLK